MEAGNNCAPRASVQEAMRSPCAGRMRHLVGERAGEARGRHAPRDRVWGGPQRERQEVRCERERTKARGKRRLDPVPRGTGSVAPGAQGQ